MDTNAVFAILLMLVGLAILSAEVFLPSGGLLGLTTFISLILSLMFAYRAWGESNFSIFIAFCVMVFLLVPIVVGIAFAILPRTSMGKKVILEAPQSQDLAPFKEEASRLEQSVGHFGVTVTMLNPGGLINLGGQRLHAVSEGLFVESGASVEIVGIEGNSVVVRPGVPPENVSSESAASSTESHLDFDFPPTS